MNHCQLRVKFVGMRRSTPTRRKNKHMKKTKEEKNVKRTRTTNGKKKRKKM